VWADSKDLTVLDVTNVLGAHYQGHNGPLTYERVRRLMQPLDAPAFVAPPLPLMEAISRMTAGEVQPNSWADPAALQPNAPAGAVSAVGADS
jgi:hypothetical protein